MINLKNLIKKNKKYMSKSAKTAGFTLFVAMIVSSLLLAVGFSIGNIILKQLLLSGSGKESQVAFYAADSGVECAQFWDTRNSEGVTLSSDGPFATSTESEVNSITVPGLRCGAGDVYATKISSQTTHKDATSTLVIDYSGGELGYKACAIVKVVKGFTTVTNTDNSTSEIPFTTITSRGYNSGLTSDKTNCDTSNARTVERGLVVQY